MDFQEAIKDYVLSRAWQGATLVPNVGEAEAGRSLEARNLRPTCQHSKTPSQKEREGGREEGKDYVSGNI
jgi:predicted transcriptional regulator